MSDTIENVASPRSDWELGHGAMFDALELSLHRGDVPCALRLAQSIRGRLERRGSHVAVVHPPLTDRELAVLVLLTDGSLSQKDIARALCVSHNTVKTHLRSLYQKLGAHSRAEAIDRGLVTMSQAA